MKAGGQALPLVVDVRAEAQAKAAIDCPRSPARFGGLDIVVNNASAVSAAPPSPRSTCAAST